MPGFCAGIRDVLYRLGITEKYRGFFYISYAVCLTIQQPERLLLITKWLYPDIAKQYDTNWFNVERNIRTCVSIAWNISPDELFPIAMHPLKRKPSNSNFISILANYLCPPTNSTESKKLPFTT